MKTGIRKAIKVIAAVVCAMSLLAGCSSAAKEEPVNKYTSESGMFAISLPGEWKAEDNLGLGDMLNLSREDGMETMTMGMAKGNLLGQSGNKVESLQDFFDYIEALFLNGDAATSELKDAEGITLTGITSTIAKEGTMTQKDGASGKIFVQCGETEDAYYLFMFSGPKSYEKNMASIKKNMTFEELEVPKPEVLSDTLRWINASYAIITKLNGGDLNLVAGFEPGSMIESSMKAMLERDWSVTDRASMDESIDWLLTEGHNADAIDYLTDLEVEGMSRDELVSALQSSGYDAEDQVVVLAAFDAKAAYGEQAIAGWDLSRAMSMAGWGYLAGFYTYEEAMDKSMEIAQSIQQKFSSWEDYMNSYFYGYSYWSGNDAEDTSSQAYERRQMYEELKGQEDSPYSVDWNTVLQKEW